MCVGARGAVCIPCQTQEQSKFFSVLPGVDVIWWKLDGSCMPPRDLCRHLVLCLSGAFMPFQP